jgi:hypothetical protein
LFAVPSRTHSTPSMPRILPFRSDWFAEVLEAGRVILQNGSEA